MSELDSIVRTAMAREVRTSIERRELGRAVAHAWAVKLESIYARYMRLRRKAARWGLAGALEPEPSMAWLGAAWTLLVYGDEETRHVFLTADLDGKEALVSAIQRDGGMWAGRTWVELPPEGDS